MEPEIRGFAEKMIDNYLTEKNLAMRAIIYRKFQEIGLITSIENAIFGALFEGVANTLASAKMLSGLKLTIEEMKELFEIIRNRSLEIKSKIRESTSL